MKIEDVPSGSLIAWNDPYDCPAGGCFGLVPNSNYIPRALKKETNEAGSTWVYNITQSRFWVIRTGIEVMFLGNFEGVFPMFKIKP